MSTETSSKLLHRVSSEALFCLAIWFAIMLVPLFSEVYDYLTGFTDHFEWRELLFGYIRYVPFLLIFLLGKLIYEPKFFFKGRLAAFFLISFVTAFVITLASEYLLPRRIPRHRQRVEQRMSQREAMGAADSLRYDGIPTPSTDIRPLDDQRVGQRLGPKPYLQGPFFPRLLMALLMMGSSLSIAVFFRTQQERLMYKEQQALHLQSELDYLKFQINPHFFMNTLNNIHALVDIDSERAKQTIIELSHLMRYILYETNQPTVSLRRELTFVRHFLKLMKLRFDESVTLTYEEPDSAATGLEVGIPPLLLLTFIENAFKHGISHREPSFIDIKMTFEDKQLHFHCANSNFSSVSMRAQQGGVGLENVKKRLQLIYPNNHTLNIVPTDQVFTVDLWIPCLQYTPLTEGLHNPS